MFKTSQSLVEIFDIFQSICQIFIVNILTPSFIEGGNQEQSKYHSLRYMLFSLQRKTLENL